MQDWIDTIKNDPYSRYSINYSDSQNSIIEVWDSN